MHVLKSLLSVDFLTRRLYRHGDTEAEVAQKVAWVALLLAGLVGGLAGLVSAVITRSAIWYVLAPFTILAFFVALAVLFSTRQITDGLAYYAAFVSLVCISIYDYALMATGSRAWGLFVLVVDGLLISRSPRALRTACALYTTLWLMLTSTELTFRFGMLDWDGVLPSYEERRRDCERPPCGTGHWWDFAQLVLPPLLTFIADYHATRSFADAADEESRKIAAAVSVAQNVATRLAGFDLDGARRCLSGTDAEYLPKALASSYERLVDNLRSYQPYLPSAMLGEHSDDSPSDPMSIPGLEDSHAALVFTDIRQSTKLWLHSPDVMREVLSLHNEVIRDIAALYGGYEVKTIGDSFMLAFQSIEDALNFGVDTQRKFLSMDWPDNLSRGAEDDYDNFLVRIGACHGAVEVERNFLTGRYDYFGSTVNLAARIEGLGTPGAMTMLASDVRSIIAEDCDAMEYPGRVEARGIDQMLELVVVWDRKIGARAQDVQTWCQMTYRDKRSSRNLGDSITSFGSPLSASSHSSKSPVSGPAHAIAQAPAFVCSTIGHIALRPAADCAFVESEALTVVATCVERTRGLLLSALNTGLWAAWGTKRRTDHLDSAARCYRLLNTPSTFTHGIHVFTGLATGFVVPGQTIGTTSQKVVTVVGSIVDTAVMAAAAGMEAGVTGLWAAAGALKLHLDVRDVALMMAKVWDRQKPRAMENAPSAEGNIRYAFPNMRSVQSFDSALDFEQTTSTESQTDDPIHVYAICTDHPAVSPGDWHSCFMHGIASNDMTTLKDLAHGHDQLERVCAAANVSQSTLLHYLAPQPPLRYPVHSSFLSDQRLRHLTFTDACSASSDPQSKLCA